MLPVFPIFCECIIFEGFFDGLFFLKKTEALKTSKLKIKENKISHGRRHLSLHIENLKNELI